MITAIEGGFYLMVFVGLMFAVGVPIFMWYKEGKYRGRQM